MQIYFICSKFPNFSETFIQREVAGLEKEGFDVNVFSLKKPDMSNTVDNSLQYDEITVYESLLSLSVLLANLRYLIRHPIRYFAVLFDLVWSLRDNPVELLKVVAVYPKCVYFGSLIEKSDAHIHAHWANTPTSLASATSSLYDLSFSFSCHAWDIYKHQEKYFMEKKIKNATHVITCTQYNENHLTSAYEGANSDVYRNYHAIDSSKYYNRRDEREQTYAIAGGSITEKKGFDNLVRAISAKEGDLSDDFELVLFGDGPDLERIKDLARELDVQCITFTGKIPHDEVIDLMAEAQFLIMPSVITESGDRDGIPNVILEGFASETPAIASDISGIPEVVTDKQTGWLVEEQEIEQLAQAIEQAWITPSLCTELGEHGKRKVESQFEIDQNIQEYIEIFRENV